MSRAATLPCKKNRGRMSAADQQQQQHPPQNYATLHTGGYVTILHPTPIPHTPTSQVSKLQSSIANWTSVRGRVTFSGGGGQVCSSRKCVILGDEREEKKNKKDKPVGGFANRGSAELTRRENWLKTDEPKAAWYDLFVVTFVWKCIIQTLSRNRIGEFRKMVLPPTRDRLKPGPTRKRHASNSFRKSQ